VTTETARRTLTRIPNKTQWGLTEALMTFAEINKAWKELHQYAKSKHDLETMAMLAGLRDHMAYCEKKVRDAAEGRYEDD
jgi:hypothetical protein